MMDDPLSQNSSFGTPSSNSVLLRDYIQQIEPTDELPRDDLRPILLGLFGEIGSVMATAKKLKREGGAYTGYQLAVMEELGDALWYFTALCRRLGYSIDDIFLNAVNTQGYKDLVAACDLIDGPLSCVTSTEDGPPMDELLLKLGESTAPLLSITAPNEKSKGLLSKFAKLYLQTIQASRITFSSIARNNINKARGRFLEPENADLPKFDSDFPEEERIPDYFEIKITQRVSGQSYLQWNNVFIGEPLTDNIHDLDGYRFHDIFHFAHAAILHWSPTFRALIKQKRKSNPHYDETQDGGRAIVVEEGLTAWIFSCAKNLNFFEGQERLSFDLLKTVHQFVHGYEVEKCPLKLWEHAILNGYEVFRKVRENNGGIVIGDRKSRTITYKSI